MSRRQSEANQDAKFYTNALLFSKRRFVSELVGDTTTALISHNAMGLRRELLYQKTANTAVNNAPVSESLFPLPYRLTLAFYFCRLHSHFKILKAVFVCGVSVLLLDKIKTDSRRLHRGLVKVTL